MAPGFKLLCLVSLVASRVFSTPVQTSDSLPRVDNEYDYIVVGSGPGGGTVASNLARANYTVLLLEAGDSSAGDGSVSSPPPQVTWDFFVEHHAEAEKNKLYSHLTWKTPSGAYWVGRTNPPAGSTLLGVYYPRGATVGGSSMINAMCTWLPPDSDWDYIVKQTGDTSFNATGMRKIFERIEKNNYLPAGTPGHGFTGWFQTMLQTNAPALSGVTAAVMNGFATAFGKTPSTMTTMIRSDPNFLDAKRDWTDGIWGLASHQRSNGQRYSSRDYVQDTISRGFPLTLSQTSLATKVMFSNASCGAKPRATGVSYLFGKSLYKADPRYNSNNKGETRIATARKEVIISGGTFNSPQLLLLSGIGDQEQLKKYDIPVIKHLPGVGNNMQDNQEMPIMGQYKGSSSFGQGGYIMYKTKHSPDGERDVFLMQGSGFAFRGFWPANQTNNNLPTEPANMYGVSLVKNHPQNTKGYVRLKSKDPQDTPAINFMHYAEGKETDMGAIKDTIALVRKVYSGVPSPSGPIASTEPPCPAGPDKDGYCGQADEDWITAQTFGHHPTSTNPMGREDNPIAVVDNRFRVHGIAGLRVVDASVFPRIPGIFPVVATFMISEKASDVLVEDAKIPSTCVFNAP